MVKGLFAALLVAALTCSFSLSTFAQDEAKKEAKKEEKHELKAVSCAPECGFMVRSHDEKEVTSIVMNHAKKVHNKDMTEKDVMGMMKTVKAEKMEKKKEAEKK